MSRRWQGSRRALVALTAIALLLSACASSPPPSSDAAATAAAADGAEGADASGEGPREPKVDIDWWVYQRRETETSGSGRLVPLYSYSWDEATQERSLSLWPLLSGYQSAPQREYFYSLPLLTLGGSAGDEERGTKFTSIVPLGWFASEDHAPDLSSKELFALPLLLWTREHVYRGSRGELQRKSTYTPLASFEALVLTPTARAGDEQAPRELRISRSQMLGVSLGGEDRISVVDDERWGGDEQRSLINLFNLSLWREARFRGRYPGARFVGKTDEDPRELVEERRRPPTDEPWVRETELGPLYRSRTSEAAARAELLSIFGYRREGEKRTYSLLPLMLELEDGAPRFNPATLTRLWPLLYHDADRRRWDVLWPLAYYRDDEYEDLTELRLRLLFHYRQKSDAVAVRLVDGLVYDHVRDDNESSTSVLLGFLYSGRSRVEDGLSQWDLLRGLLFGREERDGFEPTYTILFVRFGGDKKAPEDTSPDEAR